PDFIGRVVFENVPVLARTLTVYTLRIEVATAERLAALQAAGGNIQLLLQATSGPRDRRARASMERRSGSRIADDYSKSDGTRRPVTEPGLKFNVRTKAPVTDRVLTTSCELMVEFPDRVMVRS